MAQILVRNVAEEVKERLKRRAKRHGRSLEAEVRDVLEKAALLAADQPAPRRGGLGTELARQMAKQGVTNADVDELERIIREGRKTWSTRVLDFDP